MALIGNIAISMTTDTKAFSAGLMKATAELRAFGKIGSQIGRTSPFTLIGTGLMVMSKGIKSAFTASSGLAANMGLIASGGLSIVKNLGKDTATSFYATARALGQVGKGLVYIAAGVGKGIGGAAIAGLAVGFKAVNSVITTTVGITRQAVNQLGLLGAITGGIVAYGFAKVIQGGMALGEQTDRARITFGKYSNVVIEASDQMAKAFGISRREFIQSASAMGQIFQGAGYDEEAAAGLSVHFVKLATDLSSFAHIPMEEAMHKIQSGLVGMARPLREVGVLMSDEAVKTYAAAHGIAKLGTELSESQKVQARVGLITQELGKAQGNLALTSNSAANQVRALAGRFENLKDTIGASLLGIVVGPLSDLQTGIEALQMAWDNSSYAAESASIGVVGSTEKQVTAIGWVQKGIGYIADGWDVLRLGFSAVQSYITSGIAKIVEGLSYFSAGIDVISEAFGGDKTGYTEWFDTISEDLEKLSNDQWEGFQDKLLKPWPSESIDEFFANARKKTLALQTDVAKTKNDISGFKPKPEAVKPGDFHANQAAVEGSRDAVNMILRSQFGQGTRNDAAKQTAANTAKTNEILAKIAASSSGSFSFTGSPVVWQNLP